MHCGVKYTFIKLAYCVRTRVMFVEKLASSCKEDVCPPTILHECSLGNSQNVTEAVAWHSGIFSVPNTVVPHGKSLLVGCKD